MKLRRITGLKVQPHTWDQCYPVVGKIASGGIDETDEMNRTVRKIFRQLSQRERIMFHQATCQSRISPAHGAVIQKITAQMIAVGAFPPAEDQH